MKPCLAWGLASFPQPIGKLLHQVSHIITRLCQRCQGKMARLVLAPNVAFLKLPRHQRALNCLGNMARDVTIQQPPDAITPYRFVVCGAARVHSVCELLWHRQGSSLSARGAWAAAVSALTSSARSFSLKAVSFVSPSNCKTARAGTFMMLARMVVANAACARSKSLTGATSPRTFSSSNSTRSASAFSLRMRCFCSSLPAPAASSIRLWNASPSL